LSIGKTKMEFDDRRVRGGDGEGNIIVQIEAPDFLLDPENVI